MLPRQTQLPLGTFAADEVDQLVFRFLQGYSQEPEIRADRIDFERVLSCSVKDMFERGAAATTLSLAF